MDVKVKPPDHHLVLPDSGQPVEKFISEVVPILPFCVKLVQEVRMTGHHMISVQTEQHAYRVVVCIRIELGEYPSVFIVVRTTWGGSAIRGIHR